MKRNKLLLLLALLMTAATGAWATDYTTLAVGDVIKVGDTFSPTADGAFYNEFGFYSGETYTLIRADIDDGYNVTEKTDGAYYVFKYESLMYPYIHFEKDFAVTAISDGLEVTKIETIKGMPFYTLVLHESAATTYSVTLAEGTEDSDKWTISPTEAAEGSPVTVTYNGEKRVKSVKAVKKGVDPAKAYLTWDADQKQLVATEIPTTAIKVENADGVEWQAGTYVVEGEVNITGTIELSGDVDLIIKDGAKLTAKQILGSSNNLRIYGQANQSGQLDVDYSNGDAIMNIKTLEVHSAKVTAASSSSSCGGFYGITTFNVYGGLVEAKATGAGYGISLNSSGSINIFGGEVKAEGKGTGNYSYGIRCANTATVTVNGGKLWAENADKKALNNINLQKGTGFTGKIEYSSDKSTWSETVDANAKYVRAGY